MIALIVRHITAYLKRNHKFGIGIHKILEDAFVFDEGK